MSSDKYGDIDFGFTAVDEDELNGFISAPSEVTNKMEETSTELSDLRKSIDQLIEIQTDIMSELVDKKQIYEEKMHSLDYTEGNTNEKLEKIEGLIMPLLTNLLKNKEKEYIYWPNREPIIRNQIEKILEITRN
jgi:hypothetical protein